jgi:hypothetical protein
MRQFRKKPVVIDAVQNLPENETELLDFFNETQVSFYITGAYTFVIRTLEGDMTALQGDWLIRGIKGEVYPCKPEIFAATYEEVL